jgi:hypothetical protein
MTLKDFQLHYNNHFVAMEYYWLVLNRTFLVLVTTEYLIGVQANGMVSVETAHDPLLNIIIGSLAVKGNLTNPYSYTKSKYLRKIENEDLTGSGFLSQNKNNFRISRKEIKRVEYDASKKWGMAYYPHDGKVYVEMYDGNKRELIILGNQSGSHIASIIEKR